MAKTWDQKLHIDREPVVEKLEKAFGGFPVGASMLIATPLVMKKFIDRIPIGKRVLLPEIREKLARRYKADTTCPLTSGIFLRIVSEAAWDEMQGNGKKPSDVTPFWRAIGPKDPVVKKLRCGREFLEKMWRTEGLESGHALAPADSTPKRTRAEGEEQIRRVRRICTSLPGTTEKLSHGEPTFFLKKGVYAMISNNHHNDGHIAVWIPAAPGEQEALVKAQPKVFYRPPYVGVKGWVGIELDQIGEDELGSHLSEAWKLINSKK